MVLSMDGTNTCGIWVPKLRRGVVPMRTRKERCSSHGSKGTRSHGLGKSCGYVPFVFTYLGLSLTLLQLNLDGTISVQHPDGSSQTYPLSRLTKLYDAFEQLEDDNWDDEHEHHHHHDDDDDDMADDEQVMVWEHEDGAWGMYQANSLDDQWVDEDDDDGADMIVEYGDGPFTPPRPGSSVDMELAEYEEVPVMDIEPEPTPEAIAELDKGEGTSQEANDASHPDDSDLPWKRFDITSSCPVDHAYYSSSPAQPSKSFLGRLRKEYRILTSSLPGEATVHVPVSLTTQLTFSSR